SISGSVTPGTGIFVRSDAGPGNLIEGNFIGTDATGTMALGNAGPGVDILSSNAVTIGGTIAGAGNVISGNLQTGIIVGSFLTGNVIQGNFIGTDVTGAAALGNAGGGVQVAASSVTIGGTANGARNVISGNTGVGLDLESPGAGDIVQGNFIGTDVSGTHALGNSSDGLLIAGNNNTVGGTTAAAGNLISGNGGAGVRIAKHASGNLIQGNLIGTDSTGTNPVANGGAGVLISAGSANTIGGTTSGAANTIAFNGSSGVSVEAGNTNAVRENSIFSNGNLGILLN